MDEHASTQGEEPSRQTGYETSDANLRGLGIFVLILFGSAIVIHTGLRFTENAFARRAARRDQIALRQQVLLPEGQVRSEIPEPRLQVSPPLDLEKFRAREEMELHTYGWINRTAGVVRIPIEHAMELIARKGLPARSGTNPPPPGPSSLDLLQQRRETK